ncbi:MAG: 4Fe-4S binding protein, partial [Anaerovoracaceae bacterium]
SLDPWGTFSTITTGQFAFGTMKLGVVIFLFVLLGMALMERFFCQVLCPMGAIFAILPYLPMSVLRRNREACISGCALCEVKCPVKLALDPENNQLGECIQCGKCVDLCPKKHITFGIKKLKPTGMAAISLQTLLLAAGLIWAIYS